MSFLGDFGSLLMANGYTILPLSPGQKYPIDYNWQGCPQSPEDVCTWEGMGYTGVGINTHDLAVIDIDVMDASLVIAMTQMISQVVGTLGLVRVGQHPKRAIMYGIDVPIKKMSTAVYMARGQKHQMEILGDGQQFCAYHIHPETHQAFKWLTDGPDKVRRDDLPVITSEQLTEILKRAAVMMEQRGWRKQSTPANTTPIQLTTAARSEAALVNMKTPRELPPGRIEEVLGLIPIQYVDDYNGWIKIGMALYHQFDGDPAGLAVWDETSQRSDHYQVGCCNDHWASFKREAHESKVTFGTLIEWSKDQAPAPAPAAGIAIPAPDFRRIKVPRPPMFIAPCIGPGTLTMIYGKPGIGKSYLVLDLLRALHTGTTWLGFPIDLVTYPRSLLVDGELPKDLIDDRLDDVFETLPGDLYIISKQYYLNTHGEGEFNLANLDCRDLVDAEISHNKINVLVLDNKVSLVNGVEENSLSENSAIVQWLIRVRARGVMVILVHHSNKSGTQRGTTAYEDPMDNIIKFGIAQGGSQLGRQAIWEKARRGRPNNCAEVMNLTMTEYGTRPVTFEIAVVKEDEYIKVLLDVQLDPEGSLRSRVMRLELPQTTLLRRLVQGVADKHLAKARGKYRLTRYGEAYLVEGKGDEFDDLLE